MASTTNETLDAGSTACGDLILLIFLRMKQMQPGQALQVLAHDEGADLDIPAWCRSTGNVLLEANTVIMPKIFVIEKK